MYQKYNLNNINKYMYKYLILNIYKTTHDIS